MKTPYEKFLATVPYFRGLSGAELRIISRLVDDVRVPAGCRLPPAKREVLVTVRGCRIMEPDGSMLAITPLRLLVFGRRELLALFSQLPGVVVQTLLGNEAVLAEADLQLDSRPPCKQIDSLFDRDVGATTVHQAR